MTIIISSEIVNLILVGFAIGGMLAMIFGIIGFILILVNSNKNK